MAYKRLWVFLEGNDDERFFEGVISPLLENAYDSVRSWKYAQEKTTKAKDFLRSIKSMDSDIFFLGDINSCPCVSAKKDEAIISYGQDLGPNDIIVVIREIESWYLAGLTDKKCRELGIRTIRKTDNINKEKLNALMPRKFDSRIDFMVEILKRFSVNTAKQKNKSFGYFMSRI